MGAFNPNNVPTWTHYISKHLIITQETFLDGIEWIYGKKADGTPNYGWEGEGDKMKVTVFTEEPKDLKEMLQTIGQIEKD
ncbi:hypothetical protein IWW34DRAFT_805691 [Fusarium oxysporum f. sp. albedinis]|jgi:hypothetical protein|uniref:Uncharacterized protein n=2 Tax=Fusarium oxysporum TaxID=5507 RepID=A0A420QE96_FUSOX|nr:hypothetical protein FOCG_13210 [Fusarium oxysporum f. sp. radicis-lycopersici 26381]KAF5230207.1 hypothetical protein FOXYS1_15892 [Fusarium oxysporum]KAH7469631.1 hypothetical protein FOMA001_g14525 [Fusarium oxysporum f. sp. matthiolae]KAI3579067.1 hypothetical protein IWW34DRAFT_805691 [Fusarium oxysporum f. sp. albedinis]PCD26558.1 hypothetical protein AU210_012980 [Fusarium oxysporum f. sp. radicis-cucumerinum]